MRKANATRETSHLAIRPAAGGNGERATTTQADKLAKLRRGARAIAELLIEHAEGEAREASPAGDASVANEGKAGK